MSQKIGRIQSQKWNFLKVNLIFFKTALFFARSTHVGIRQGAFSPTTPGAATSGSQHDRSARKSTGGQETTIAKAGTLPSFCYDNTNVVMPIYY